jgi:hypothetical protein
MISTGRSTTTEQSGASGLILPITIIFTRFVTTGEPLPVNDLQNGAILETLSPSPDRNRHQGNFCRSAPGHDLGFTSHKPTNKFFTVS